MGQAKYIYFTDENLEQLKKVENMSKLINDLLKEHFNKLNPETMTPEEIRKMIAIKKIEKEYKDKLEKLK